MLSFLSTDQSSVLLKLFGNDTEAGRQLRRMFAPTQHQSASRIQYPKCNKSGPAVSRKTTPSERKRKPQVRYPKLTRVNPQVCNGPGRPGRKPHDAIRSELEVWTPDPLPEPKKDLSLEKTRLQENLQFAPSKMLPERIVGCPVDAPVLASEASPVSNKDKELIAQILQDVSEAQSELDTTTDLNRRRTLQRRLDDGIDDLKLICKHVN